MSLGDRFLAWIYTGPLGHLYGVIVDVTVLWLLYVTSVARRTLRLDGRRSR